MSFSHVSVGGNMWAGLTTMATASSSRYAFPNWEDNDRGNPGWAAKVDGFEEWVAAHASEFDVFQNKFCYIDQDAEFATYRDSMLQLASADPTKTFVWWTMPIMTEDSNNGLDAKRLTRLLPLHLVDDETAIHVSRFDCHGLPNTEASA